MMPGFARETVLLVSALVWTNGFTGCRMHFHCLATPAAEYGGRRRVRFTVAK
jgi:hypothetical protein